VYYKDIRISQISEIPADILKGQNEGK